MNGRGDMGRTPALTRTDLLVSHELGVMGGKRVRFELNVINLFNQKTATHIFNSLNKGAGLARADSAIDLSHTDLARGYDYNALILASPSARGRLILATASRISGRSERRDSSASSTSSNHSARGR